MIPSLAKLLVLLGALVLLASLFTTRKLIAQLSGRTAVRYWYAMLALILVFIVGYLGYTWAFWNQQSETIDLLVPAVFFLGGCFVWLTASLSLHTALSLMRISLLERENVVDPLTKVFNRRYFDRRLGEEVTRAGRYGLPMSLLMLDIDRFKQVNDQHGHQADDEVLVEFARRIGLPLREQDILARYGGEGFMVIAPHTAAAKAVRLGERLREGVASLSAVEKDAATLIQVADVNLYEAKREGRDRVVASGPDPHEPSPAA